MTNKTATALKPGQTELATKATTKKAKSTARENSTLQMAVFTMASFPTMKSPEEESTSGTTARSTKDSGSRTKCMGTESSHGLMGSIMKENLGTIRDMETAPSDGKTGRYTKDHGLLASNTERVSSSVLTGRRNGVNGSTGSERNGSVNNFNFVGQNEE